MTQKVYIVEGRQFRTESEYRKALRDKQLIDKLRKEVDFGNPSQLAQLVKALQQKKAPFLTLLGQDFAEEAEEALKQLLKPPPKGKKRAKPAKAAGAAKKKPAARGNAQARGGQGTQAQGAQDAQDAQEAQKAQMEKYVQEELRRRDKRRKLLVLMCSAVAVACLGYFGIYTYEAIRTQQDFARLAALKEQTRDVSMQAVGSGPVIHYTQEGERVVPEILDEYKNLYNANKRLIGWLKIDDTNIDYPVMQTSNNEYFLTHNYNQQTDRNGALFLDKDCDILKPSTNLIVYGHHMKSGNMFGTLDKYSSEDFYKKHPTFQFDTIYEKGTYEVMYVFRSRIYNEEDVVFKYYQFIDALSEQEFDSNMAEMAAMSLYDTGVTASYGDQLLTLSTCDYYVDNGRFVVVARRVEKTY